MLYTQHPYRCRFDWGQRGTHMAAERGDILVIVDVLSFSTTAVTALHHGGIIYPYSYHEEDPALFAQHIGAELAVRRQDVPAKGRFSLSPATFEQIEPGTSVVLASPNGATCSRHAREVPYLFVGALVNAHATASAISSLLTQQENMNVTIIACGERWQTPSQDEEFRVAIEDYLGAGAILSYLPQEKSPEASVCAGAFMQAQDNLAALLWDCGSGRELRAMSFEGDVTAAAQLNAYNAVPLMRNDHLEAWSGNAQTQLR